MNTCTLRAAAISLSFVCITASFARASELRRVVRCNTPAPGGTGLFLNFGAGGGVSPGMSGDNIVFGAVTEQSSGIYAYRNHQIVVIVDGTTFIPGTNDTFTGFSLLNGSSPSISGENVAFVHRSPATGDCIWGYINREFILIADHNTPVPGGVGTFHNFGTLSGSGPSISGENVVFQAESELGEGVYLYSNGQLSVVADWTTPVPGVATNFLGFGTGAGVRPAISGDNIAFLGGWAFGGPGTETGIYARIKGQIEVIADTSTPIPGGVGTFGGFNLSAGTGSSPAISGENVAFVGENIAGDNGIYARLSANLQVIADRNTQVPGSTDTFVFPGGFAGGSPAIDGENVVFTASNPNGVYLWRAGQLETIADTNTPVPDSPNTFTQFGQGAGTSPAVSGDYVAFFGTFPQGIYTTAPPPPPVPTLSTWSITILTLLLLTAATVILHPHR